MARVKRKFTVKRAVSVPSNIDDVEVTSAQITPQSPPQPIQQPEPTQVTSDHAAFVRSLTVYAMMDTHMSELCANHVVCTLMKAIESDTLDAATLTSVLLFINKLCERWMLRGLCRGDVSSGTSADRGLTVTSAETLSIIAASGEQAHVASLRILRETMEVLMGQDISVIEKEGPGSLTSWVSTPGFLVVVEMLHRGQHGPVGFRENISGTWTTSLALMVAIQQMLHPISGPAGAPVRYTPFVTIMPGCISLAGTLRKLVIRTKNGDITTWENADFVMFGQSAIILVQLVSILMKMYRAKLIARLDNGVTDNTDIFAFKHLACLTHICIKCIMSTLIKSGPVTEYEAILSQYQEHNLQHMDAPSCMIAVGNQLNGRFLPSCCNPTCINMTGVSEATLHTELCSGCRRVRYCCKKCQKEDFDKWHGAVCGTGGWLRESDVSAQSQTVSGSGSN